MNAVEIEEAISQLADQPFDPENFPYAFLEAFGNKETTIKRLRSGTSNKSDLGGVLQTSNIHIATSDTGQVTKTLTSLRESPATAKAKAKFILATDGADFEAEDLNSGETVACAYKDFPDHFGFFLPLAGITTVRQIAENSFDIRATSRLNRLYVELLKDNPQWGTAARRHDMNHLMARLIFCFFAEDTDIFHGEGLFTNTVAQMSARDSSNTHEVVGELFRAMNTKIEDRAGAGLPRWANGFPYVNGGLFSGNMDVPRFSKIARSYLLHIGNLDWTKINPDIFGSMIQAVAEDEERGALGMHYTSVPNILKVLNPLFLDELRARIEEAGVNPRTLLNLRKRIAKIRIFDPACGSGNFLVIAYKEMRAIEAEINKRRGEAAFGLKGVDTNDNLGLKDGPTAVPLPYASNGTAWTAQITDPTVKRFAGRISAVVPPPPIPPKEAPVSWSQIYMNQDALMKSADRLMAAWEMAGPVGSSVEAPLKVIMIAGKTFIAGEDGAALYLAKKDQTYEDALRYLKSPTQSQQFARLVQAIREGRPVPSADPTMVKAARALADPKLGNSGATIAWDSMMSPEALSAMLRKACIEVGSEAIADKAGNVLTHMSQRKAVFDEVRLERSQAVHMMKLATTTEAQREQLRIVIEHANQVIALTYRVERVEQYAAGQFIGEATDKLATALFGPETRTQEAH